jgi:hypothetical protein
VKSETAIGIVAYAEGISVLKENPAKAGVLLEQGRQAMENAAKHSSVEEKLLDTIKRYQANVPRSSSGIPDRDIMGSQRAGRIFSALEASHGISREDFEEKALASGSSLVDLAEKLADKVDPDAFVDAVGAAKALGGKAKNDLMSETRTASLRESLRDRLKRKLEQQDNANAGSEPEVPSPPAGAAETKNEKTGFPADRDPASTPTVDPASQATETAPAIKGLEGDAKEFFASPGESADPSLFSVVHRKYREKETFLRAK